MYENFFGFKERPFQLVPNPAYLFLSRSHEEALAHLDYAVSRGDGFVEITGEVGTGKTTLCRVFLDNLEQNTEVAYIFNPKLDAIQLLKAINDELGVDSKPNNTKTLIDRLNFFLMEKKAEGKKVILVIDEAQNLSKEVLEQLRLLSNLETTTTKLLQIILVGQPELAEMLDSYELRQLGQRITLSYHLMPLNFNETREYIEHRIRIASRKPGIRFSLSALWVIYKYARGIPRLINIACDRAILTAYGLNQHKITGSIARTSIRELAGRGDIRRFGLRKDKRLILLFSVVCAALLVIIFSLVNIDTGTVLKTAESQKKPVKSQPEPSKSPAEAVSEENPAEEQDVVESEQDETEAVASSEQKQPEDSDGESESAPETIHHLADFLGNMDIPSSKTMALKTAVELWDIDPVIKKELDDMEDVQTFFRLGAKQNGLLIYRVDGELELIKKLNLPAIFEFSLPTGLPPGYLTLVKTDDRKMTFRIGDDVITAEPDEVEFYWSGPAYIPWKNFFSYSGSIPRQASEDAIMTLKMIMRDIGFSDIEMNAVYDDQTREAVEAIQEKHGLTVDGVVGPLTKIILYNEMKSLEIPHIGQ
ncbi:MAG: hypothetical protein DRI57_07785 [Deltaproteobacteria bacterium]|nr:MAG: hypothetical protein DRI57_07785 [Deltaproteobacteria bacterium]